MSKQSILILSPGFAAHEQDHNCIPALQLLVKEFLQKDLDIQIVALEYPFSDQPYHWHGATVFPCNGQNRRWLKWRTILRATRFCNQILNRSTSPNPQIPKSPNPQIHSFWLGWASFVGERVGRKHGITHFTTLMGQDVLPSNQKHLRGLNPERCERLIAVSDFQNQMLEKTTGLRAAHIIPWGVSETEMPASIAVPKTLDVLGVGSLIPIKNWGKWLKTIALILQAKPSLQAELIGGGPEKSRLEVIVRHLGLEKNVHFAGALPRTEVLTKMREASVLLHTSDFESYGFVFAEAAMFGMKIVSTPVGVATEMGGACAENEADLADLVLKPLTEASLAESFVPYKMSGVAAAYLKK